VRRFKGGAAEIDTENRVHSWEERKQILERRKNARKTRKRKDRPPETGG